MKQYKQIYNRLLLIRRAIDFHCTSSEWRCHRSIKVRPTNNSFFTRNTVPCDIFRSIVCRQAVSSVQSFALLSGWLSQYKKKCWNNAEAWGTPLTRTSEASPRPSAGCAVGGSELLPRVMASPRTRARAFHYRRRHHSDACVARRSCRTPIMQPLLRKAPVFIFCVLPCWWGGVRRIRVSPYHVILSCARVECWKHHPPISIDPGSVRRCSMLLFRRHRKEGARWSRVGSPGKNVRILATFKRSWEREKSMIGLVNSGEFGLALLRRVIGAGGRFRRRQYCWRLDGLSDRLPFDKCHARAPIAAFHVGIPSQTGGIRRFTTRRYICSRPALGWG